MIAGVLAVLALAAGSPSADLSVKWFGPTSSRHTGVGFTLQASVVNAGPDAGGARVNVQLPTGVRASNGTLSCTPDGQILHCDTIDAPLGDDGSGTIVVTAPEPGTYTFVVSLDELAAADPNTADNTDSITVDVVPTAGPTTVRPSHPRARRSAVVGFAYPGISSAHCAASLGAAVATAAHDRATCTIRLPTRAKGRRVHGTLTATSDGKTVTRRFTFHVA